MYGADISATALLWVAPLRMGSVTGGPGMRSVLISLEVQWGKPDENLLTAEKWIRASARLGADIICLPEMAVVTDGPYPHGQFCHLSAPIPGRHSDRFSDWARQYATHIAVGLLERTSDGFYSSAILINPEGKIVLKHRQVRNGSPYLAGDSFGAVDTDLGRVSIAICGDVWHEQFLRQTPILAPDYIYVPMDWSAETHERGIVNNHRPPAFLREWKGVLANASSLTGAVVMAVNCYSRDTDSDCGACGGAFVFKKGEEIRAKSACRGHWRQPTSEPLYVFDIV